MNRVSNEWFVLTTNKHFSSNNLPSWNCKSPLHLGSIGRNGHKHTATTVTAFTTVTTLAATITATTTAIAVTFATATAAVTVTAIHIVSKKKKRKRGDDQWRLKFLIKEIVWVCWLCTGMTRVHADWGCCKLVVDIFIFQEWNWNFLSTIRV